MKRLLAILMSILMVCTLAMPVMADTNVTPIGCDLETAVAKTGEQCFSSVSDAAMYLHETIDGEDRMTEHVIYLLKNYTGGGFAVGYDKITANSSGSLTTSGNNPINIKLDLQGNTYTVTNPTMGSAGTETNGFQFLKGSTVYITNGSFVSTLGSLMFQNYSNLTFDGVNVTNENAIYVMSNNNGKTIFKGGTVVNAGEGNHAMDSFCFGNYTGGDVVIEDATINGDVEAANGGKLTLDGGTINGDVTSYNYPNDGDSHEDSKPAFILNSGTVNGNVTTSNKGQTTINGGEVTGKVTVDNSDGATSKVEGGIVGEIGENVETGDNVAKVTSTDGTTKTAVGQESINEAIENAGKGATVEVTKATEGLEIDAPEGTKVTNNTETEIKVNDSNLGANGTVEIPESPSQDDNNDKPSSSRPSSKPSVAVESGNGDNVSLKLDDKALDSLLAELDDISTQISDKNTFDREVISKETAEALKSALLNKDDITLKVNVNYSGIAQSDAELIKSVLSNNQTVVQYLDIDIEILVDGVAIGNIKKLDKAIEIEVTIDGYDKNTTYKAYRVHADNAEYVDTIEDSDKDTRLEFFADKFSTYAIVKEAKGSSVIVNTATK